MAKQKAAGAGYSSPLNMQLGQVPKATNPEFFGEMVEVYNAIHLLNAYLDGIRGGFDIGKKGGTLAEQMPFKAGYWFPADQDINAGDQVFTAGNVIRKGITLSGSRVPTMNWGIALTDAKKGELCQMGIPPAVINVPGCQYNKFIFGAKFDNEYAGMLLRRQISKHITGVLGVAIAPDYVFLSYNIW